MFHQAVVLRVLVQGIERLAPLHCFAVFEKGQSWHVGLLLRQTGIQVHHGLGMDARVISRTWCQLVCKFP